MASKQLGKSANEIHEMALRQTNRGGNAHIQRKAPISKLTSHIKELGKAASQSNKQMEQRQRSSHGE